MRLRPILIGLTPNPNAVRLRTPLYGRASNLLARVSGLPLHVIHEEFERINLLPEVHIGKLSIAEARKRVPIVNERYFLGHRDVFLLGEFVAEAFRCKTPLFERQETICRGSYTKLPAPSGLCRTWNEPSKRTIAGKLIREAHERWKAHQ